MASIHEDIGSRLDRLERELQELSNRLSRSHRKAEGRGSGLPMKRVSLVTWLQITGPTFAALVFGFGLLWNAQQATTAQMLEANRTLGRLEGSIAALDQRIERLGESVDRLAERLGGS